MDAIFSKLIGLLENFYLAAYIIAGAAVGIGFTFLDIPFFQTEFWMNVGLCYFTGMISTRIGSLIIEPLCKCLNIIKKEPYETYLKAETKDSSGKLKSMSQVCGYYITMSAVSLILLAAYIIKLINIHEFFSFSWIILACLLGLLVLFVCSYRKQTNYVVKRIKYLTREQNH